MMVDLPDPEPGGLEFQKNMNKSQFMFTSDNRKALTSRNCESEAVEDWLSWQILEADIVERNVSII